MNGHLVAVKVRIVSGTYERMKLDGAALHEDGFKRLNTKPVQRGRAVQKHRMVFDDALEHIPNLCLDALNHALGAFDVVCVTAFHKLFHDEGLEKLQRHFLGEATLVHLKLRPYHDNATARIVHALTEEVLAEAALLAAKHIRKGF